MKRLLFFMFINLFTLNAIACGGDVRFSVPHIHDREALLAHVANHKQRDAANHKKGAQNTNMANVTSNKNAVNANSAELKRIYLDNFLDSALNSPLDKPVDNYSESDTTIQPMHLP